MNEGGQVEAEYDEKHVELLGVGRELRGWL